MAAILATPPLARVDQRADLRGLPLAADMGASASLGRVKQVDAGPLNIGYLEAGPAGGQPVILLHGWPYAIHAFTDVVPILASAGYRIYVPHLRGFGTTTFRSPNTARTGQQAAIAMDVLSFMDALRIPSAILAGFDWGARAACVIAALRPDRCTALVSASGYLIGSQAAGRRPLAPVAELAWWYQFYFATERGEAGYAADRAGFANLVWRLASPQWAFTDETFGRSASCLFNPDHVAIVVDNYRWRLGISAGEREYDAIEAQLAGFPVIGVPTVTIEGDANHAPHPAPDSYTNKFIGRYRHVQLGGGVGHNPPEEAPAKFAEAVFLAAAL